MDVGPALAGRSSAALQREVLEVLPLFWDGRDVRALHHPVWFRQFGDAAFTVRTDDGALLGYLLGCVTRQVAYVHAVATHPGARSRGLGRAMHDRFSSLAEDAGCRAVEAVTMPSNSGSIGFHERLGFRSALVPGYAGPGEDRVHFVRPVGRVPGGGTSDG